MELVALDLEGSGAQDRDGEAILEIAIVPIIEWQPDMASVYCTLINPGRTIPRRPWISPGLTDAVLLTAPSIAAVEPELTPRINGKYIVGHNIGVDWRLLHRRFPHLTPAGLIDTLRLARRLDPGAKNDLRSVVDRFALTRDVDRIAAGSAPHRALWDTIAVALILSELARRMCGEDVTGDGLLAEAGILVSEPRTSATQQPSLFD